MMSHVSICELIILVPCPNCIASEIIWRGSAVVGKPTAGGFFCYFEGGIYNQANLKDYYSKLVVAASRQNSGYLTSARNFFRSDEVIPVGRFDPVRSVVTGIDNEPLLKDWCGESAEALTGRRLPPGSAAWPDAASIAESVHTRTLARTDGQWWGKTQAGQVMCFRLKEKQVVVYDHDAPSLPALLTSLGLDDQRIRDVIGVRSREIPQ